MYNLILHEIERHGKRHVMHTTHLWKLTLYIYGVVGVRVTSSLKSWESLKIIGLFPNRPSCDLHICMHLLLLFSIAAFFTRRALVMNNDTVYKFNLQPTSSPACGRLVCCCWLLTLLFICALLLHHPGGGREQMFPVAIFSIRKGQVPHPLLWIIIRRLLSLFIHASPNHKKHPSHSTKVFALAL